MAKVSEADWRAAWNAWYRWLADRASGTPSKSEQCNTYYAEAIAQARAEGYRQGLAAAANVAEFLADTNACTDDDRLLEIGAQLVAEKIRALLEAENG